MANVRTLNGYTIKDAQARENITALQTSTAEQLAEIRAELAEDITEIRSAVGSPLVAATAAAMTDHNKIYVYTGSEDDYTAGNWYYWNGTVWTSGGVYNSQALETDKTLSVSDMAADAAVVGADFKKVNFVIDNGIKTVNFSTISDDTAGSAKSSNNVVGQAIDFGTVSNWYYMEFDVSDVPDFAIFTITTRLSTSTDYCDYIFADEDDIILSKDNTTKPANLGYVTIENVAVPAGAKTLYVFYYSSKSSAEVFYTVPRPVEDVTDALNAEIGEDYAAVPGTNITWEQNGIAIATGNNATSAGTEDTRIRTASFLPSTYRRAACTSDYLIRAFVYDAAEGTYLGTWNGFNCVVGTVTNCWFRKIDFAAMGPGVKIRLVLAAADLTSTVVAATDRAGVTFSKYLEDEVTAADLNNLAREVFNVQRLSTTEDGKYTLYAGGVNAIYGTNNGSEWDSARCKTGFIPVSGDVLATFDSADADDYRVTCFSYSSNAPSAGTHSNTSDIYLLADEPINAKFQTGDAYIRFAFWRVDGEDLTTDLTDPTSDYSIIRGSFKVWLPTDATLTQAGAAADAYAVGTAINGFVNPYQAGAKMSHNPIYEVPSYIHNVDFIEEKYNYNGVNYFNTQGICTDGSNIYFARRTFDTQVEGVWTSGLSYLKKVNAITRATVAEDHVTETNYGHVEDMCFVPSYVPGFDNGTVDRLYILGINRSPAQPSGGYVYVVNANTLEYITAFQSGTGRTFLTDVTNLGMLYGIAFNPDRGQFVLKYSVLDDASHNEALIVCKADGTFINGIKFNRVGTGTGIDADDNYIYYPRYISTGTSGVFTIKVNVFDYNFNKVLACDANQFSWEMEGFCHIGATAFVSWNEIAAERTGFKISKSDFVQKARFATPAEYPGWTGGLTAIAAI